MGQDKCNSKSGSYCCSPEGQFGETLPEDAIMGDEDLWTCIFYLPFLGLGNETGVVALVGRPWKGK